MVTRTGGMRRKSRYKMSRALRTKGKVPITKFLQTFTDGDRVQLVADTFFQGGMYHPRFHGRIGTIVGKQGKCYHVEIADGGLTKIFIVHPVHLKRLA